MGCGASAAEDPPAEEPAEEEPAEEEPAEEGGSDGPGEPAEAVQVDTTVNEEQPETVEKERIPDYWVNKDDGDGSFHTLFYIKPEEYAVFSELMEATHIARCTQDRLCPKGVHDKTRGGCECWHGDDPGLPVALHPQTVIRVENSGMWKRFTEKSREMQERRAGEDFRTFSPIPLTHAVTEAHPELFAPLNAEMNETYTFHGTSLKFALSIARDDFKLDLAGSGAGSMYGPGVYTAESCMKADEYAPAATDSYYDGLRAMLVCRTYMGKLYYTRDRKEDAIERAQAGIFDSTLGDRIFREFVVYDADQVYPEYIILYRHRYSADDEADFPSLHVPPRRLLMPLYWTNLPNDLEGDEPFYCRVQAQEETRQVLEQLIFAQAGCTCLSVSNAFRIESSAVLGDYLKLRQEPDDDGSPEPLDWAQSGLSRTRIEAWFEEEGLQAARHVPFSHMMETKNECALWYPFAQADYDAVQDADVDFYGGDHRNGSIYHASIQDAVRDACFNHAGHRTVGLCRCLIGRWQLADIADPMPSLWGTESLTEEDRTDRAAFVEERLGGEDMDSMIFRRTKDDPGEEAAEEEDGGEDGAAPAAHWKVAFKSQKSVYMDYYLVIRGTCCCSEC
eukprot:TRINITY_DN6310_c0_g1_i1.p1 TRINITY_DN6310_c0_g1~~TRINITY_DN6310_c0_g1_i1.p1  ORF type:complete len:619 (-),score=69.59 TRINITY_DN6310_c0_g1_i1:63-1919(-)